MNHYFLPFAVENFRSFNDPAKKLVQRFLIQGLEMFVVQKISLAIPRGNVAGIVGAI